MDYKLVDKSEIAEIIEESFIESDQNPDDRFDKGFNAALSLISERVEALDEYEPEEDGIEKVAKYFAWVLIILLLLTAMFSAAFILSCVTGHAPIIGG